MTNRVNVLGVGISALNLQSALAEIAAAISTRRKGYICVTGVHGVMEAQSNESFRNILNNAFLCTPDGMPMVWMGKINGQREMTRVYGPDLMLDICAWSEKNSCRHFFYGGAPGVADSLAEKLKMRFPKMQIIVWVGLSTPKQEKFMAECLPKLDTTLMVGVGAAFDFLSGRVKQAPRWMQRSGLEWFYRLCSEPRRLAGRYLKNNPVFVAKIAMQLSGLKKYTLT
jgi:N-acetylglucosaminyldiphosphoundecaprenol N-acetyl-beta-D-mannosaminyltransferase